MPLYRCSGEGMNYSENKPRISGTAKSYAGNIVWVGSIDNYLELQLKDTDKNIKLVTTGSALEYKTYIDGNQIDSFTTQNNVATTKIYNLSNNKVFKVAVSKPLSGDITVKWDYKIW